MFIAIYPFKFKHNFGQGLTALGIEYVQGNIAEPFITVDAQCVQNFDFAGITHSADEHFLIPEDFGATKDILKVNEVTIVNFIENEITIENLDNPLLDKCELLFSFRMNMQIYLSKSDGLTQKQITEIEKSVFRVIELVEGYIYQPQFQGIDLKNKTVNQHLVFFDAVFNDLKINSKLKTQVKFIEIFKSYHALIKKLEKYGVFFKSNIPEISFKKNSFKLERKTQGSIACFYDESEGVFLTCGYSKIENGFLLGSVASVYFSNVSNKLKSEVEPYGYRDFEPFQRNANIVDPVKSLSIYPPPEKVFSPHQPWVNRMFVPIFTIDMGSYKSEWSGLELPFVLPVVTTKYIDKGLADDCYYGKGYIAFRIDKENYLHALFQENELFDFDSPKDSKGNIRKDFIEFHQQDLDYFQQKKQYFKVHGNHGQDSSGERNTICNFGGEGWDGNWSASGDVPNNLFQYQAKTNTPQLMDKQGNKFYYIADTEMGNWIYSCATALMFYEPKNRVILFSFNWT